MSFQAKRIIQSAVMHLVKPPEIVFPLLCPTRELDWLPGWEYEMIFSKSGYNEEGCIFSSKMMDAETIWTTVKFDTSHWNIEFLNVSPGFFVLQFNISLTPQGDEGTVCKVEQIYTGITEEGNRRLEQENEDGFRQYMSGLERILNHYLVTGQKMIVSTDSV